jgi:metal-dependent HD superfamily phosphatase/phosphodiesterase
MNKILTFDEIKNNSEMQTYLEFNDGDRSVCKEHGSGHALYAAKVAGQVLKNLGYSGREQELAKIAAYVHDIGNMVSRNDHAQSSAIMFLNIIREDINHEDIFAIVSAIGCHEDTNMNPVSPIAAALVFGDKTDIYHETMSAKDLCCTDKRSRVVAACKKIDIIVNKREMTIRLRIVIDTAMCSVMDYFEIFISVTNYCTRASKVLNCNFELYINGDKFL